MNRTVLGFCLICLGSVMLLGHSQMMVCATVRYPEPIVSHLGWIHTLVGYLLLFGNSIQQWFSQNNENSKQ